MIRWLDKDPADVDVVYSLDLTYAIGAGDSLTSTIWGASSGIVVTGLAPVGNVASLEISGGTAGDTYVITCTATLESGQVIQKSAMLKVREQ